MWQSLTLLLRVFSGMVEFQPHVWTLPYSDLKTCHFVLSAASLVLPFFMEQVIIRLTKFETSLAYLEATLAYFGALPHSCIYRTDTANKYKVFQRSDCYLTLFRGTSCANDL